MLRPGLQQAFSILESVTGFEDRQILEIGGDEKFSLPHLMLEKGARSIVVSNIDGRLKGSEPDERISVQYANALDLGACFEADRFDIVFGTAILEHIPTPAKLLASIFHVLKPGGFAFLSGGPLWTSAKGHHLWVRTKKDLLRFADDDCPVEPWSHLVYSPAQMHEHLSALNRFDDEDVQRITQWIYHNKNINRLSEKEIDTAIKTSPFSVLESTVGHQRSKSDMFHRARAKWHSKADITISNRKYLLEKPA